MGERNLWRKPFGDDSKVLLGMLQNERKEWPLWRAGDVRPKISYLHRRGLGKWTTRVNKEKRILIVQRHDDGTN